MSDDKTLKIFSKSGKRMKDEEKRMYEMNREMENAIKDYESGFPRAFGRDVQGIFNSDKQRINKAAKAEMKANFQRELKRIYGNRMK